MPKKINTEYTEDQKPCIVVRKPCGCYVAVFAADEDELSEIKTWKIDQDLQKPSLVSFLREPWPEGSRFEFKPVSFVHSGGLNFGCKHRAPMEATAK